MKKFILVLIIKTTIGTRCKIDLFSINDNEQFCHQLVLIRGQIICPTHLPSYPDSMDPVEGRFIVVENSLKKDMKKWPINSFHQFKALVRYILIYFYILKKLI